MVESTLYLQNLPKRPQNRDNYIKLLLKSFNPNNEYCDANSQLPKQIIPLKQNNGFSSESIRPLDTSHGIVSISRPNKVDLLNKCFITFTDADHAKLFMERFQRYKIQGRCIKIQYAKKQSFVAISKENPGLLQKILKTRDIKQNKSVKDPLNLRRKLRRLRNKLRSKNKFTEEEITSMIKEYRIKLLKKELKSSPQQKKLKESEKEEDTTKSQTKLSTKKRGPQPTTKEQLTSKQSNIKTVNVSENLPNKILLVQNLPDDIDESTLINLFQNDGFVEVRLVSVRHLAFVEYDSIEKATMMLNELGFTYQLADDKEILIGFAK